MFDFFKKKKQQKKQGKIDKIVTSAILGAAIGSVVGISVAPKKGSETRKEVSNSAKGMFNKLFKKGNNSARTKFNKKEINSKQQFVQKIPEEN